MRQKKALSRVFERIAAAHNTTVAEVRREMEAAIRAGCGDPSPEVRARWAEIPRKGDVPTPDEWIAHIARQATQTAAEAPLHQPSD